MTRTDRRTLVRQLRGEGLSQRAIAKRLKISKDTVRRDLADDVPQDAPQDEPGDATPDAPSETDAPQVSGTNPAERAPADEPPAAPLTEPDDGGAPDGGAQRAPVAHRPRQVAHPDRLVIDLGLYPGLRDRLAELAGSGVDAERLIVQAVTALAAGYRRGVATARIVPGPFEVRDVVVGPLGPGCTQPAPRPGVTSLRDIRDT
ncbi:hypothetical protein [Streptomyces longwoodensis]|uniref:hypothetical protein n=1 Tax=Streptomyces longwoodensis TaxID=68231 RepID=UPI0036E06349